MTTTAKPETARYVKPQAFFMGHTVMNPEGVRAYLEASGNEAFLAEIAEAEREGLTAGEILTSLFAKLCYASLREGANKNVKKIRSIHGNLLGCHDQGHNSVWQHCVLNFVFHNCSRVLTHEAVRHRAGTAFSQTSGRYVRTDRLDVVLDPILAPVAARGLQALVRLRDDYEWMCNRMGLNGPEALRKALIEETPPDGPQVTDVTVVEAAVALGLSPLTLQDPPMDYKKKVTSALRRYLPNGQANELAMSFNLASIRHIVQVRTAPAAEWEVRFAFGQVFSQLRLRYKTLFHGARVKTVDGTPHVYGMKMQPYDYIPPLEETV